jgi:hypothetical protein
MACLAGCGGSDLPELGEVSGVVTLDGEPLPNAIVEFQPSAEGRPSSAETDEEGRYELLYLIDAPGALLGEHTVRVRPIITEEMDNYDPEEPDSGEPPPTYPTMASDGSIKKTVEAGDNDIPIELKSD